VENAGKETPSLTGTDISGGSAERLKAAREKLIRRYQAQVKSKITTEAPESVGPEPAPRQEAAPQ
jgi:hypothetical protein